ncbi:MAG: hypothetical protein CVT95_09350 [Bacteroidetes bacterium HGW-Bacteroidetes-12]|nr:MAG: hypothetical protein CVT95_09350 [Bacteroidetes bacterium HGW-Bacteroidetes-12]
MMQTLIVKTESEAATKLLLAFLKTVRLVKSVTLLSPETATDVVNEPAELYNWINPSRLATEEEIDLMLDECENSPRLTTEEAKSETYKLLDEWQQQRKK